MRIAQVAPLAESVPPKLYGGTERVVAWLCDELMSLGHDVTLFASGDSRTSATLLPVIPRALRLTRPHPDPLAAYAALLEALAEGAPSFDVVHCHIDWVHLPLMTRLGVPHLTTIHNRLDHSNVADLVSRFSKAPLISISNNHRTPLPSANWLGTVYHGLPPNSLTPSYEPGRYLAFLGRLTRDKGPEPAIRIAQGAGMRLLMAAKIPRTDTRYFQERLKPLIDGDQIKLVGEVDDVGKAKLLGGAAALLFPIDWPEPFGLVMIEAMACGTPVIAYRRGSVPEVIDDGTTGFVVETEEKAVAAIKRLHQLDRQRIRRVFERRFTSRRMAEDYLRHYGDLVSHNNLNVLSQLGKAEHAQAPG